jgi:hypothetical protein
MLGSRWIAFRRHGAWIQGISSWDILCSMFQDLLGHFILGNSLLDIGYSCRKYGRRNQP